MKNFYAFMKVFSFLTAVMCTGMLVAAGVGLVFGGWQVALLFFILGLFNAYNALKYTELYAKD